MKRFAAAALALALLLSAAALAFDGSGYPAWDGMTAPGNSLCGTFGEERVTLAFDPSTDYSSVAEGLIQVCFFAYDATEEHYLELYLLMPQDVAEGDVITESDACDCSICLYETSLDNERIYYAGTAYESEAAVGSFKLRIESLEHDASSIRMSGSFSAQLIGYDLDQPAGAALSAPEAYFDFALPLSPAAAGATPTPGFPAAPEATPTPGFPALPGATFPTFPDPTFPGFPGEGASASKEPGFAGAPAFTLPPDYAEI